MEASHSLSVSSTYRALPRREFPIDLDVAGVRAVLDGRKTTCRVPIKRKPAAIIRPLPFSGQAGGGSELFDAKGRNVPCPFGRPGDLLYVREPFAETPDGVLYRADEAKKPSGARWRSPSRMSRKSSRIVLAVVGVHPERLSAIDANSAIAESLISVSHGMEGVFYSYRNSEPAPDNWVDPVDAYSEWWESMYGARGRRKKQSPLQWSADPWVWVVEFRRIEA